MIDPVTGWFEIVQYDDKRAITIANLVETMWLSRYPRPMKIMYDQGKHFIGHELRNSLIEMEYRITAKPITWVNPISKAVLESIHQVLGNHVIGRIIYVILHYFIHLLGISFGNYVFILNRFVMFP